MKNFGGVRRVLEGLDEFEVDMVMTLHIIGI